MTKLATTKLSSRGQVVIPEEIRDLMHLHPGDQFFVLSEKDVLILKVISRPDISEFDQLISAARKAAELCALKKSDIVHTIREARNK